MRRMLGLLVVPALVSLGVVACDESPQITDTPLGFTISEGLLILLDGDPTLGSVILSSSTGNCKSFQMGLNPQNILLSDFLTFNLQVQDPDGGYLPIAEGVYTIVEAAQPGSGNYAACVEYETSASCAYSPTGANSGTLTLQPFAPDDGGTSDVTYSVVFGYSRFSGAYNLTTCRVPADVTEPDAGTCAPPGAI